MEKKSFLVEGISMSWLELIEFAKSKGYSGPGHVLNNNAKAQAYRFLLSRGYKIEKV